MPSIKGKWGFGKPKDTDPLQAHVDWYVREQGFVVVSQTETSVQLIKKKQFSLVWALLWFLVLLVGLLIYLFYYIAKSDKSIYLSVVDGKVRTA